MFKNATRARVNFNNSDEVTLAPYYGGKGGRRLKYKFKMEITI